MIFRKKCKKCANKQQTIEISKEEAIKIVKDFKKDINECYDIYSKTTKFVQDFKQILNDIFEKELKLKITLTDKEIIDPLLSYGWYKIIVKFGYEILYYGNESEEYLDAFFINFIGRVNSSLFPSKWSIVILPSSFIKYYSPRKEIENEKFRKIILQNSIDMIEKVYPLIKEHTVELARSFNVEVELYKLHEIID